MDANCISISLHRMSSNQVVIIKAEEAAALEVNEMRVSNKKICSKDSLVHVSKPKGLAERSSGYKGEVQSSFSSSGNGGAISNNQAFSARALTLSF